jgi:hypothetical protein
MTPMAKSTPVADIEQLADRIATILTLTADAYSTASVAAANIRELADEPAYAVIDVLDDHGDALRRARRPLTVP